MQDRLLPRGLALCAALLWLAAAWFAWPHTRALGAGQARPALCVLLVDAAPSSMLLRPQLEAWLREALLTETRQAQARGEQVLLLRSCGVLERLAGPVEAADLARELLGQRGAPLLLLPPAGERQPSTRLLAEALASARQAALDGDRPAGRIVLYSDLAYTGADPRAELERAAACGLLVQWRALPEPSARDLSAVSLSLPEVLEAGAPLTAELRYWLEGPAGSSSGVRALCRIEDSTGQRVLQLDLPAAQVDVLARQVLDLGRTAAGHTRIEVALELLGERDALPQNNRAEAWTWSKGARLIGVLSAAQTRNEARNWLGFAPAAEGDPTLEVLSGTEGEALSGIEGLEFLFLEPAGLPAALQRLDALVLYDLEPEALPFDWIEQHVRQGLGLFVLGGYRMSSRADFPAGQQPPEGPWRSLPLLPDSGQQERDVLLLVDGSGSMAGAPFDAVRGAALQLLETAPPRDRLVLYFFTASLQNELVLRERRAPGSQTAEAVGAQARAVIDARVPGGQTQILVTLEELAQRRARAPAPALCFLLSDGIESTDPALVEERSAQVRAALAASKTELVVLAVGADANLGFLAGLVPEQGRMYQVSELADLRGLFEREVQRARSIDGPLGASICPPSNGLERFDLCSEIFGLFGYSRLLPEVDRALRMRLAPGAELLGTLEDGSPLLAAWRLGRGSVAMLASRVAPGWCNRWSSQPGLWGPLLRWLARSHPEQGLRLALRQAGELVPADRLELSGVQQPDLASLGALVSLHPAAADASGVRGPFPMRFLVETADLGLEPVERRFCAELASLPPQARGTQLLGGWLELELEPESVDFGPQLAVPLPQVPELRRPAARLRWSESETWSGPATALGPSDTPAAASKARLLASLGGLLGLSAALVWALGGRSARS